MIVALPSCITSPHRRNARPLEKLLRVCLLKTNTNCRAASRCATLVIEDCSGPYQPTDASKLAMPPPRNASTYNARPPTREREELAKRCLERSKNALLEFQKKSAALGVAVAPMTAPDGTTVAYDHFDGVRVAPPVENAVIKLVEENAPAQCPAPKPTAAALAEEHHHVVLLEDGLPRDQEDGRARPLRRAAARAAPLYCYVEGAAAEVAVQGRGGPADAGATGDLGARAPRPRRGPAFSPMPVAPARRARR